MPDADLSRRGFLNEASRSVLAGGLVLGATASSDAMAQIANASGAADAAGSPTAGPVMPPDIPRVLQPTRADLGTLFADVEALASERSFSLSFLGDRFQSVADFHRTARGKLLELLQYSPPAVAPEPQRLERVDCGTFVREKIVFSTTPRFRVPAYVLIPKSPPPTGGRFPAIVDLHSHGGMFLFGKEKVIDLGGNHAVMTEYHKKNYDGRPTATEWVKHGYVVISIDAFMFGERRAMLDADLALGWDRTRYSVEDVQKLNQVCRGKETTLAKAMVYAGLTWPGIVFWDDMRTVDYLLTRPDVDPKRIGCVGISMGGYRSFFLAGLDPRVKAACVTGFMSTVPTMRQAHVDTHSWVHYLPGLHQFLDWPDVVSLHAPQPLLVQQCEHDRLFRLDGMRQSLEQIAKAYAKAGASDQFVGKVYDAPHQFTRPMQDDALAFFDRHLKG